MNCNISMVEGKLPPGFRFHPRDDELICDYLMKKLLLISSSSDESFCLLVEVDLNKCEPWDLPERACVGGKEWYFYSQRDRKYATGLRTNRATVSGYWKATGKDRAIARKGSLVGMRKTLVFYQGRAPKGRKTEWVMHEFRLEGPYGPPKLPSSKEDWVLCRVFHKSNESVPPRPTTTTANGYDESGCSSLPDLMDTFISFDQNPDEENEEFNNNNNNNNDPNNLPYEQVSCFSNNNYNQTTPNSTSSSTSLFHVAPSQPITIPSGSAAPYHTPAYGNDDACDRHVIKAVLSHFSNDVKDSTTSPSPVSMTAGSSQSYLSDVAFPTMWTHHY